MTSSPSVSLAAPTSCPITYHLFNKRGEPGERRKFVASDHVVVFTSNGQVHHHWTQAGVQALRERL